VTNIDERLDVSVLIATCGRPQALFRCLEGLAAAPMPPREVIIVDQGNDPPNADRLPARIGPVPLDRLRQERRGLAAARNLALVNASSRLVGITDDDCVPSPEWLSAATAALADPMLGAVCGPVIPLPDPTGTLMPVSTRPAKNATTFSRALAPWRIGSGGNLVARRDWLVRVGGYDERLGSGSPGRAGEDVDLLHRLLRAGALIRFEPAAQVFHEQKPHADRRARRFGYGHGVGAACSLWARERDPLAPAVLGAWLALRLRLLAGACVRRRGSAAVEELLVLRGTAEGVVYGLRTHAPRREALP